MNTYKWLLIAGFLSAGAFSCTEERMEPLLKAGNVAEKVSDLVVENIPGGARVSYSLPEDRNLAYVEAEWITSKGVKRNEKASSYSNTLNLTGFGDMNEYEVRIYSVNWSEGRSDPQIVKINPLKAPVFSVFESLSAQTDFGGCYVQFDNALGADLMIGVITPDSTDPGKMASAYNYYTSQKQGYFNVRGYAAEKRLFGFFVRDRWENYSDTMYKELTPLYEEELEKREFKEYYLPGDINDNLYQGNRMSRLWDNNLGSSGLYISWTNAGGPVMPGLSFAFDLGNSVKLSRFQLIQRYADLQSNAFNIANPKKFEVWGTNDLPDADGSWANWTKLMDAEVIKPSGLPVGQLSNDDIDAVKAGSGFNFSSDAPPVRYLRFRILENWNGVPYIYFAELTFWGQKQ